MDAEINILYSSSFYKIIDFNCNCKEACISKSEYSKSFNISFIRKGNFIYKVFRNDLDAYNGYAIIDKPSSEHIVEHHHEIPDQCTIIDFSDEFYQSLKENHNIEYRSFFLNQDIPSLFVKTDNKVEYLHYLLLTQIKDGYSPRIQIDNLVIDILQWFLDRIDNNTTQIRIPSKLKKQHLKTIENAKDYIFNNFYEDITLQDIAFHCNLSPFHFSRIFKMISHYSPYQFLLDARLVNAKQLIKNTDLKLKEVCYQSGFNNVEHFNAAFKRKYNQAPSYFKKSKNS